MSCLGDMVHATTLEPWIGLFRLACVWTTRLFSLPLVSARQDGLQSVTGIKKTEILARRHRFLAVLGAISGGSSVF